ncbi:MAG: SRPBCC family protein [Nocardioidaceae bacterium]
MDEDNRLRHQESVVVDAGPEVLFDLVTDIGRTGEWSPICTGCWWDDPTGAGRVGAWFTGRNELPHRTWETRSKVVVADRPTEFAFHVGDGFVRWGYTFQPTGEGTVLTESWHFLPAGIEMFHQKYGEQAETEIADRIRAAQTGISATLAAIKRIAERG